VAEKNFWGVGEMKRREEKTKRERAGGEKGVKEEKGVMDGGEE